MELGKETKTLLKYLRDRKCIGGKHTEEGKVFRALRYCTKEEQKRAYEEWRRCVQQEFIVRMKKTGEWHVSLNPRKLRELYYLLEDSDNVRT